MGKGQELVVVTFLLLVGTGLLNHGALAATSPEVISRCAVEPPSLHPHGRYEASPIFACAFA